MNINKAIPDKQKYLQIISTIARSPKCLYYLGKLPSERIPSLAIIGTRKLTAYGKEVGYKLAYSLAQKGVIIISGLALGADALIHRAALDAGGTTIAVLPCGLDRIYPQSNRQLALDILAHGGALISEYPSGTQMYRSSFVARNRLISGMSDGLLVIEAAAKSGTMHTAYFALEQGRPVMALPGNIISPMSEGCNNLIASGARLIRNTDDILQELGWEESPKQREQLILPLGDTPAEHAILQHLAQGERDGEQLLIKSGLAPAAFQEALTMLEIKNIIYALGGNKWGIR